MSEAERIEGIAADWLARRDAGRWSDADRQALEAWLAESTAHRVAWLRLSSAWERGDRLGALRAPAPPAPPALPAPPAPPAPPPVTPAPRRHLPRFSVERIAAALVVAGGLAWFGVELASRLNSSEGARYDTAVGQRQAVALADGSHLTLNTDTRLRAQVDADSRTVWLDRGEAYFEVAHDRDRPFVVLAGDRRITVLGTRFSVRREGTQVHVAVAEGRVQIAPMQASKAAAPAVLTRNQVAIASAGNMLVLEKPARQIGDELSWRQGKLVFDQVTLGEAAAEFNRYNARKLVIADPAVAQMRIGGSFEATNVAGFVALLQQGFGLRARDDGMETRISN